MENANTNPFFVALFFVGRCLAPLFIMLGLSYLLKRFGLITTPPEPPPDRDAGENNDNHPPHANDVGGRADV